MNNTKNKMESETTPNKKDLTQKEASSISLIVTLFTFLLLNAFRFTVLPIKLHLFIYMSGTLIGTFFYLFSYVSGKKLFLKETTIKERIYMVAGIFASIWPIVPGIIFEIDLLSENLTFLGSICSTVLLLELLKRQLRNDPDN